MGARTTFLRCARFVTNGSESENERTSIVLDWRRLSPDEDDARISGGSVGLWNAHASCRIAAKAQAILGERKREMALGIGLEVD